MSGVSLFFLIVIVIVGGVVAYLGDNIGRSIGKKRLRVGRLRPKHTAMIGTFVAGMLGTLATIVVLALVSEPVRAWIIEGEQAKIEAQKLRKEIETLEQNALSATRELQAKNNEVATKDGLIAERDQTLTERNAEIAEIQARSNQLVAQVKEQTNRTSLALAQYKKTQTDLKKLEDLQKSLQSQIADSRTGLADTQKENVELQRKNFELQQMSDRLNDEIAANEKTIEELNALIASINAAQEAIQKDFDGKMRENQLQLQESAAALEEARTNLSIANKELSTRRGELQYLAGLARQELGAQRLQPLIYNRGDEVARIAVPPNTPRPAAQAAIERAIADATEQARLRGAARGSEATFITLLAVQNSRGLERPVPEQIATAVTDITGHRDGHLLVVRAPINAFKEEPLPVSVEVIKNPVVYQAEDVILTLPIDGRNPETQVIDQIFEFLQSNLYNQAVKDGMIPAIGQETPIGEVTRDQILEMANRVVLANRNVRLQILAATETRAGDKLRIDFRLRT